MTPSVGSLVGLVIGTLFASMIGCASGAQKAAAPSPRRDEPAAQMPGILPGAAPGPNQSAEHQQIAALDKQIDDELARMGLPSTPPPESMTAPALAKERQCRPPTSDTCRSSCTLSSSICGNAARICELAKQLGDDDSYANDRCARGKISCESANRTCCSCQQ